MNEGRQSMVQVGVSRTTKARLSDQGAISTEARRGAGKRASMYAARRLALLLGTALALTACDREVILPGERFDVRTPLADTLDPANGLGDATIEDVAAASAPRAPVAISLGATRNVSDWTHRNTSTDHRGPHLALAASLTQIFATDIGAGDSRKARITATPVSDGARVFTLDALAQVSAVDAKTGAVVWTHDLTPEGERSGDASGGGLAIGAGSLFVTSGFGTLTALNPATGAVKWTQKLDSVTSAAPTVEGGTVYVVSNDGVARGIDAADGRVQWMIAGAPNVTNLTGGAAPAIAGRNVILPLGSGELVAALRRSGTQVWGTAVAGERRGRAYANFTGITGDPVVVGSTIYAGNPQGKLAAVNANSGERLWTAAEGAYGPVWPVDGALFFLSDQSELVRMNAATGAVVWAEQLPYFVREKPSRRRDVYAHFGPVLAGGRLLVASDDGQMRGFDPASGAVVDVTEVPGGAATAPIVVNGTAYLVTTRGQLLAFR